MRNITAKGGVLDGKTFTVHDTQASFTHHAAPDGHYKVNKKTATWLPDEVEATVDDDETEETEQTDA